jgi:hypothetical protein
VRQYINIDLIWHVQATELTRRFLAEGYQYCIQWNKGRDYELEKDVEGSGSGLIEVIYRSLQGMRKSQSGLPMFPPRIEPSASQIKV